MVNKPNNRYIIQYDYDLDGKEIIIPSNSILSFEGGKLNNGILNSNNLTFLTPSIFENIELKGTINEINTSCFINITADVLNNIIQYSKIVNIESKEIECNKPIVISKDSNIEILRGVSKSSNKLQFNGTNGIEINKRIIIDSVSIRGNNCSGSWNELEERYENGYVGFLISKGTTIKNCNISSFQTGLTYKETHIVTAYFDNITISYCSNYGIYQEGTGNYQKNNIVYNRLYVVKCGYKADTLDSKSTKTKSGIGFYMAGGYQITISNSVFEYNTGCGIYLKKPDNNKYIHKGLDLRCNYFERNKYANILINLTTVYVQNHNINISSNFFTEAGYSPVEDALKNRKLVVVDDHFRTLSHLEDYNIFLEGVNINKYENKFIDDFNNIKNHITNIPIIEREGVLFIKSNIDYKNFDAVGFWKTKINQGLYRIKVTTYNNLEKQRLLIMSFKHIGNISIYIEPSNGEKTVFYSPTFIIDKNNISLESISAYYNTPFSGDEYIDINVDIVPSYTLDSKELLDKHKDIISSPIIYLTDEKEYYFNARYIWQKLITPEL